MKSWVDISIAGRSTERHRLSSGTTTIGASAAISLRGIEGLAAEHFSLRPQPEGCWVELVESAPEPFTFDGRPSRGCLVPWGQDLYHGSIRLSVQSEGALDAGKGTSPILWVALLVLPLTALSFVYKPRGSLDNHVSPADHPPALFGQAPPCSAAEEGALDRASVAQQLAFAKNERGVFEYVDAADSVHLMREAAACYALAGREGLSQSATEAADTWSEKLSLTYRRGLLELQLARRANDMPAIVSSARRLTELLRHAGPASQGFLDWLDAEMRDKRAKQAALAAGKKKKKR